MSKGVYNVPAPVNEPVKQYAPGSAEKAELEAKLKEMKSEQIEIPMFIGGEEVRSGNLVPISPPHDHQHILGSYHQGDKSHVEQAIAAALAAREDWVNMDWEHRASIFLKAADLLAGPYRQAINASTMLGQSKNAFSGGD